MKIAYANAPRRPRGYCFKIRTTVDVVVSRILQHANATISGKHMLARCIAGTRKFERLPANSSRLAIRPLQKLKFIVFQCSRIRLVYPVTTPIRSVSSEG